jgi:protein phosphatase
MDQLRPHLQLEVGQFSHQGLQRPNNEDWLGTFQPDDEVRLACLGSLFLVADGMGGHQSGELASRVAVDRVIGHYVDNDIESVPAGLTQAFEAANASLYQKTSGRPGRGKAGTTLLAAVVRQGELWIANVGDSRAYLLRSGRLHQISHDHSWVAELSADRGLAPGQPPAPRYLITRALGLKPEVAVDVYPPVTLRHGDRILLCTDGLTAALSDPEIGTIAARYPPQQASQALIQAANDRGGPDNVSVIVIELAEAVSSQARRWRPLVLILVTAFVAVALIVLGFVLGWLLFR